MRASGQRCMLFGIGIAVIGIYQHLIGRDVMFWLAVAGLFGGYIGWYLLDEKE